MVTAIEHRQQAVRALRSVEAALRDLPLVAAEWESLDDGEQMAWAIEWSNEMARLERLARYAAEDSLTSDQLERYRRLVRNARDLLPVMDRLGVYQPRVLLDG
jgi:hypothetical protein